MPFTVLQCVNKDIIIINDVHISINIYHELVPMKISNIAVSIDLSLYLYFSSM